MIECLFEKFIVAQLFKKSYTFMEPEGSLPFYRPLLYDHILSQLNPFHNLTLYF